MTSLCPDTSAPPSSATHAVHRSPVPLDRRIAEIIGANLRDYFATRRRDIAATESAFTTDVVERLEHFTLGGGKRLRPLFAWWGWRAGGGAADGSAAATMLRAASALELIQAFALIHDDVMDGSALRRGNPSLHTAYAEEHRAGAWAGDPDHYGLSLAVLAGDLALIWADDLLEESLPDPVARARVREPWRAMRTEMSAGQFLDLHAQARGDASEKTALRVDRLKTAAYSVERPLHFGAALAGAETSLVHALRCYGSDVGTAFQLRDDLLGVYGDTAQTGKPLGDDLREGKRTLLLAIGLRRADERGDAAARAALEDGVGDPGLTGADVQTLGRLLDELGARADVEQRLRTLTERGLHRLATAPIGAAPREALRHLALGAAVRTR